MTKKTVIRTAAAVLAVALAACAAVAVLWYLDNRMPNTSDSTVLYVYPESTTDAVLQNIIDSAAVKYPGSLKRVFAQKQVETYMQPGRYELKSGASSVYVARMLNNGWQSPSRLVLSGTMRKKDQIAKKISNQLLLDSAAVYNAMCDRKFLSAYGFTPENVFSMIIPDTYEVYWTMTVDELFDKFKAEYDKFWTDERLSKAQAQGLTREEVSIVASIVKGESNYEPEYPSIAGVYLNRLHEGMKLQADPTIAFCYGYTLNRILNKHLTVDSPYNTYTHEGLPPGPICVPTKACLDAVLNPDTRHYLFFCANSDFSGTHKFASTYAEHLKNARAFQQALNKRNKGL